MSDVTTCRQEIEQHREKITKAIHQFNQLLASRARLHDQSKLEEPQLSAFAALPRCDAIEYGTDRYLTRLEQLGAALEHHYSLERHHPEHYEDGVAGMTLVDLVEMFIDWQVTWSDHGAGTFSQVIERNRERFSLDTQLTRILHNTAADPTIQAGTQ